MKLQPLGIRILCEPISEAVKSAVLLPDSEKKDKKTRPEKGRVIAVGRDYKGELKKGDVVYFEKFTVAWLSIGKLEYVVGLPEDFFCIEK